VIALELNLEGDGMTLSTGVSRDGSAWTVVHVSLCGQKFPVQIFPDKHAAVARETSVSCENSAS
jgi:hypothetical protein